MSFVPEITLPEGTEKLRAQVRAFLDDERARGTVLGRPDSWFAGWDRGFSERLAQHGVGGDDAAGVLRRGRAVAAGALRGDRGAPRGRRPGRRALGVRPAGRPVDPRERHRRPARPLPAGDHPRRVLLLHRHERGGRRLRPRGRRHPRRARRRRHLAPHRHQDVDRRRPRQRRRDRPGPQRPRLGAPRRPLPVRRRPARLRGRGRLRSTCSPASTASTPPTCAAYRRAPGGRGRGLGPGDRRARPGAQRSLAFLSTFPLLAAVVASREDLDDGERVAVGGLVLAEARGAAREPLSLAWRAHWSGAGRPTSRRRWSRTSAPATRATWSTPPARSRRSRPTPGHRRARSPSCSRSASRTCPPTRCAAAPTRSCAASSPRAFPTRRCAAWVRCPAADAPVAELVTYARAVGVDPDAGPPVEELAARSVLAGAGLAVPDGPLTLVVTDALTVSAAREGRVRLDGTLARVPRGREATVVVVTEGPDGPVAAVLEPRDGHRRERGRTWRGRRATP